MSNFNPNITSLTFISSESCNLNCSYCNLAKNSKEHIEEAKATKDALKNGTFLNNFKEALKRISQEQAIQIGQEVKAGDTLGYIEAMKTYNAIRADFDGILTAVVVNSGDSVEEDDVIMKVQRK